MFFPKSHFAYDYARKRLKKIEEMGYFKHYRNHTTDEYIYYMDKRRSFHDNCIHNVYANLIYYNAEVFHYEHPAPFMDRKLIADGFIGYRFNNIEKLVIIEVEVTNNLDIEKYEKLYELGELLQYGKIPTLIVISAEEHHFNTSLPVVSMTFKCSDFVEKVLTR
jgi:hypothetical protein